MWNKQSGRWIKQNDVLDNQQFERTLQRISKQQKCLRANGWHITESLDDIYRDVNRRHPLYLRNNTDKILIASGILFSPGEIKNIALFVDAELLYSNSSNAEVIQEKDEISTSIRRAIKEGYASAADARLFQDDNLDLWQSTSGLDFELDHNYTKSQVEAQTDFNEDGFVWSQELVFDSDSMLEEELKNFKIVAAASTENIDTSLELPGLIIDGVQLQEEDVVLLKDQNLKSENGTYVFANRRLEETDFFKNDENKIRFGCFVLEGLVNKEKTFLLQTSPDGSYSSSEYEFEDVDQIAIRSRVDYNFALQNQWNHIESSFSEIPIIPEEVTFDWAVFADDSKWIMESNRNWIVRDGERLGLKDSPSDDFSELDSIFRLVELDGKIIYLNIEDGVQRLYEMDPSDETSIEIFNITLEIGAVEIIDFQATDRWFWFYGYRNGQPKIFRYRRNVISQPIPGEFNVDLIAQEFQAIEIFSQTYYFLVSDQKLYQFDPNGGINLIDPTNVSYLTINEGLEFGTSGDQTSVVAYYLDTQTLKPRTIEKNLTNIVDWVGWETSSLVKIIPDFSKTKIGIWDILDGDLRLNGVSINDSSLDPADMPRISQESETIFDGKDEYGLFNDLEILTEDFTFQFEVNPYSRKTNTPIFWFENENSEYITFRQFDDSFELPKFEMAFGGKIISMVSDRNLELNKSNVVTISMRFNPIQEGGYVWQGELWFNEIRVSTASGSLMGSLQQFGKMTGYLGRSTRSNDPLFFGAISEFRIFNESLNITDIQTRKDVLAPDDPEWSSLILYWRLSDDNAQILDSFGDFNGIVLGTLFYDETRFNVSNVREIQMSENKRFLYALADNPTGKDSSSGLVGTSGEIDSEPLDPTNAENFPWLEIDDSKCLPAETSGEQTGTSGLIENSTSGVGTSGEIDIESPSSIFRIDLVTEDVDEIYSTTKTIESIYVDENTLYWLEDDQIIKFVESGSNVLMAEPNQATKFVVINGLSHWLTDDGKIFEGFLDVIGNTIKEELYSGIDIFNVNLMWGYNQTQDNIRVVYLGFDDVTQILASQFGTSELIDRGFWPFDITDDETVLRQITYQGKKLQIKNNRVLFDGIDVDPEDQKWNWNGSTLWAIANSGDLLWIGTTLDGTVRIWLVENSKFEYAKLLTYESKDALFTNPQSRLLDLDVISKPAGYTLGIIRDDVTLVVFEADENGELVQNSVNRNLLLDLQYPLFQIQTLGSNQLRFVVDRDDMGLWIADIENTNNLDFWKDITEFEIQDDTYFGGNFGLFAKKSNEYGTDGSIEVLNPYTRWNVNTISLETSQNLNSKNFIDLKFTGLIWSFGESGQGNLSLDFGNNWQTLKTGIDDEILASDFWDRNNGFVVGRNGLVSSTTNTGRTYTRLDIVSKDIDIWDVKFINENLAMIVGDNGLILLLERLRGRWRRVDRVVNLPDVTNTDESPNTSDSIVAFHFNENNQLVDRRINHRKLLKQDENIWILGDQGVIVKLNLDLVDNLFYPNFTFYRSDASQTFIDGVYIRKQNGLPSIEILTDNGKVLQFVEFGSGKLDQISWNTQLTTSFTTSDFTAKNIEHDPFDVKTLLAGTRNTIIDLDSTDEIDSTLPENFKPRMLFTDYSLAKKLALFDSEGKRFDANTSIPKYIFDCFKFKDGQSIEFSSRGPNGVTNALGIQDWYYTRRRITELGTGYYGLYDSWPYNKRFVAKSNIENYQYSQTSNFINSVSSTRRSKKQFGIQNELYEPTSNLAAYNDEHPERTWHTVIYVEDASFEVEKSDVINLTISRSDVTGYDKTIFDPLLFNDKFIVKWVENFSGFKKIVLWELLPEDLLQDYMPIDKSNGSLLSEYLNWNLKIINLNYFDGSFKDLKQKISDHFVGNFYDVIIDVENELIVKSISSGNRAYFNLENQLNLELDSIQSFDIEYPKTSSYLPNYNINDFLVNIDPTISGYDLEYADDVTASLNELQGPTELSIARNTIFAGVDLGMESFVPGTFIDVSKGGETIERVLIISNELVDYQDGSGQRRRILTDTYLEDDGRLGSGFSVTFSPRTLLSQISEDLTLLDNHTFGITIEGENQKGSDFSQWFEKNFSASAYSKIIASDVRITSMISALVWTDELEKLRLYVYDWFQDPSFGLRPIEAFEIAIPYNDLQLVDFSSEPIDIVRLTSDYSLKKSITILISNWDVKENLFGISNLDFNFYNYILTDGLTMNRLNQEYGWILNAEIRNAVIGEELFVEKIPDVNGNIVDVRSNRLKWYGGDWICGEWEDGRWISGTARNIRWLNGQWFSRGFRNQFNVYLENDQTNINASIWFSGEWFDGTWDNGIWNGGEWFDGIHLNGEWKNGTWYNGQWQSGSFDGGIWKNGTWFDGTFTSENRNSMWENGRWLGGDFENGLWLNGIFDQTGGNISRFGTKSSLSRPTTWEYGIWINGEFHNGLNTKDGQTVKSKGFRSSTWLNGIWKSGDWFGGTWNFGVWENGTWHSGRWIGSLPVENVSRHDVTDRFGVQKLCVFINFSTPHYFKQNEQVLDFELQDPQQVAILDKNEIVVTGQAIILETVPDLVEDLGWSTNPKRHVVEIIDEKTVCLKFLDVDGRYKDFVAEGNVEFVSGPSTTAGTSGCFDPNIVEDEQPIIERYLTDQYYTNGVQVVSLWMNGNWKSGIWFNGNWKDGIFEGGNWIKGTFENGQFGI